MDFGKEHMEATGHGIYTVLPATMLPPLYLAYNTNAAGDSGKVHSDAKQRWLNGDKVMLDGMQAIAGLADDLLEALKRKTYGVIPGLMRENFRNRRTMCVLRPELLRRSLPARAPSPLADVPANHANAPLQVWRCGRWSPEHRNDRSRRVPRPRSQIHGLGRCGGVHEELRGRRHTFRAFHRP